MLFTLSTCKKYPEDKFISFTTVKMRLEGEWQLERIEINDENVGYKYDDSLVPLTFKDYKFWFKFCVEANDVPGSNAKADLLMINKSSKKEDDALKDPDVSGFDFYLDPKLKKIGISGESTRKRFPIKDTVANKIFTNLFVSAWKVRNLYNKIFIIEMTKNNIKHRLSFKKIRNK
jgi:hypothetical protein